MGKKKPSQFKTKEAYWEWLATDERAERIDLERKLAAQSERVSFLERDRDTWRQLATDHYEVIQAMRAAQSSSVQAADRMTDGQPHKAAGLERGWPAQSNLVLSPAEHRAKCGPGFKTNRAGFNCLECGWEAAQSIQEQKQDLSTCTTCKGAIDPDDKELIVQDSKPYHGSCWLVADSAKAVYRGDIPLGVTECEEEDFRKMVAKVNEKHENTFRNLAAAESKSDFSVVERFRSYINSPAPPPDLQRLGYELLTFIDARLSRNDNSAKPECTGMTASWCPKCGDCKCDRHDGDMSSEDCPLHSRNSEHAESPEVSTTAFEETVAQLTANKYAERFQITVVTSAEEMAQNQEIKRVISGHFMAGVEWAAARARPAFQYTQLMRDVRAYLNTLLDNYKSLPFDIDMQEAVNLARRLGHEVRGLSQHVEKEGDRG